jgi:hypothetical protein
MLPIKTITSVLKVQQGDIGECADPYLKEDKVQMISTLTLRM